MGLKAFIFLALLLASEISGGEGAETEQIEESYGEERPQDRPLGGGYGGRYGRGGQRGGRNGRGGRCGGFGCCGGGHYCRCCISAAEAEAYAATQAKAKPWN